MTIIQSIKEIIKEEYVIQYCDYASMDDHDIVNKNVKDIPLDDVEVDFQVEGRSRIGSSASHYYLEILIKYDGSVFAFPVYQDQKDSRVRALADHFTYRYYNKTDLSNRVIVGFIYELMLENIDKDESKRYVHYGWDPRSERKGGYLRLKKKGHHSFGSNHIPTRSRLGISK